MKVIYTKQEVMTNLNVIFSLIEDLDFVKSSDKVSVENAVAAIKSDFEVWTKSLSEKVKAKGDKNFSLSYFCSPNEGECLVIEVAPDHVEKVGRVLTENAPLLSNVLTGLYGLTLAFKSVLKSYKFVLTKLTKELDQIDAK